MGQGTTTGGSSLFALTTCLRRDGGRSTMNAAGFCIAVALPDVPYKLDFFRVAASAAFAFVLLTLLAGAAGIAHTYRLRTLPHPTSTTHTAASAGADAHEARGAAAVASHVPPVAGQIGVPVPPPRAFFDPEAEAQAQGAADLRPSSSSLPPSSLATRLTAGLAHPAAGVAAHVLAGLFSLLAWSVYAGVVNAGVARDPAALLLLTTADPDAEGFAAGLALIVAAWTCWIPVPFLVWHWAGEKDRAADPRLRASGGRAPHTARRYLPDRGGGGGGGGLESARAGSVASAAVFASSSSPFPPPPPSPGTPRTPSTLSRQARAVAVSTAGVLVGDTGMGAGLSLGPTTTGAGAGTGTPTAGALVLATAMSPHAGIPGGGWGGGGGGGDGSRGRARATTPQTFAALHAAAAAASQGDFVDVVDDEGEGEGEGAAEGRGTGTSLRIGVDGVVRVI
jgi:hypothetical protein